MEAFTEGSLLAFLATVPDPRSRHGRRHPLSAILSLVCCAIMCGAKSYAAIGQWAQDQDITLIHRLGFTRRPAKSGGIRKVLIALDRKAFEHRPDPMGRGVVEPTDRRRSVTAGGLRPGRQVGPGELRRPPESRAPALATGT